MKNLGFKPATFHALNRCGAFKKRPYMNIEHNKDGSKPEEILTVII